MAVDSTELVTDMCGDAGLDAAGAQRDQAEANSQSDAGIIKRQCEVAQCIDQ